MKRRVTLLRVLPRFSRFLKCLRSPFVYIVSQINFKRFEAELYLSAMITNQPRVVSSLFTRNNLLCSLTSLFFD